MNQWLAIGLASSLILIMGLLVWVIFELVSVRRNPDRKAKQLYATAAQKDVEHIFDENFRQELRNRGLLHFEKIISENAMFLQQDLRLTAAQMNDYMKVEIKKNLAEEFTKYEQSIMDAKQLAIDSINKTQAAIEQERKLLTEQLDKQFEAARAQMIQHFEANMADIINHYIMTAIGDQIDLNDQLEFIIGDLEANKKTILEDISRGA